mgnify:CR=1 FL=1
MVEHASSKVKSCGLKIVTVAWCDSVDVTADVIGADSALAFGQAAASWHNVMAQSGFDCAAAHHKPVERYLKFRRLRSFARCLAVCNSIDRK